ncbi:MAG TPA: DUF5947 family protein [Candidatus Sulfotelmatobacter sp.]|nr:DUF5947 family protein [Candidatus Sulfotelmatobacter sp.]
MSSAFRSQTETAFATLRQFARRQAIVERCELCHHKLAPEHEHLVEPRARKLICACDACAILFEAQSGAKYKRVPRRVVFLSDFQLTDAQWDALRLPIEMAFFFKSTPHDRVIALYPSPAGPTESLLSLDTWEDIVERNPILKAMDSDVTALLVNRVGYVRGAPPAGYFLVPIDECYKLVGLIRAHWRGFSGGAEVWREIAAFFAALKNKAVVGSEAAHA